MKVNQEEKEQEYGLKVTVFVVLAVALSFFCAAGALLDTKAGASKEHAYSMCACEM